MKKLSLLTLVFAILSAVFFLLLITFRQPLPFYPLMNNQDALDLLTSVVLIPLYWLLFKYAGEERSSLGEEITFMVLAVVWVEGHGMHLAANSINNLIEGLASRQVIDLLGSDVYRLTYFLDEHLSHILWHFGLMGLAVLLVYRDWRRSTEIKTVWWEVILAGIIYGFTMFCIFLEGQTVVFGLPFTLIVSMIGLVWWRKVLTIKPVLAFFFVSCVVAVVSLAGWGLYWGGFPQFSEVGLL